MITKDDTMLAVFQVCKDVYFDHQRDAQAARAWLLEVFKESDASDECIAFYLRCIDVIDELSNKKAPVSPTKETTDATETPETGCQGHCTTTAGGNQEEE